MKKRSSRVLLALLLAGILPASAATESTAVVHGERVNVRGTPSLVGEVITQLKGGETVTVLEEITVAKPKTGEPNKWLRIQMPANTPVWVNTGFVDRTNKTVLPRKLNVRAGPGENYSVVGVLERGDTVKEIRVVDNWTEIETPAKAYGFVAAEYIALPDAAAAAVAVAAVPPSSSPATVKPTTPAQTPPPIEPPMPAPIVQTVKTEPPPAKATEMPAAPVPAAPPMPPPMPPVIVLPPAAVPATPAKRIVSRQGIVRTTTSIQAPTYYELVNAETRKTVNYLHAASPNVLIKTFRGQPVVVSGEEVIDDRWPNIPVLEVDSIHLNP